MLVRRDWKDRRAQEPSNHPEREQGGKFAYPAVPPRNACGGRFRRSAVRDCRTFQNYFPLPRSSYERRRRVLRDISMVNVTTGFVKASVET